ncbi:MAG TPA: TIGR03435 family protein [Vicinamibacterales bacterium]|nr:TIGR03435 family protein [Vicinamibacterales bacterium]
MRKIAFAVLALSLGVGAARAQTFEVASVKVAPPLDPQKILSGQQRVGMKVAGSNVDIESVGLPELLALAFKLRPTQMKTPSWLNLNIGDPLAVLTATRFTIHAKLPSGAGEDQVPQMLQALLVDRFKLAFHRETKEQNAYALVVGRDGSKLEPSPPDEPKPADAPASALPDPVQVSGNPQTGMTIRAGSAGAMTMQMGQDGIMHMVQEKVTLDQLAATVERFVDRPVVDQTGLKGTYKVSLDLSMTDLLAAARAAGVNVPAGAGGAGAPAAGPADPGGGVSIYKSIEKMGLKLEPRKAQVEYLVIDNLEKTPTED